MGMFAGHRSFERGDLVTDSDLVIPVFELEWHNGYQRFDFLWDEYVWSANMFDGMDQEVESAVENLHVCSGGMGAAVNCKINLVNVEDSEQISIMGMSGVSSESPGAGAFTPYYGRKFLAKNYIPPGMELYASYGEKYFKSRQAYATVPMRNDFKTANALLKKFLRLQRTVPALYERDSSRSLTEALYNFIAHDFPIKSRMTYALPTNTSLIRHVLATGGTANATYNESIRDLDWLQEHGQCMDNIKDGISTLPHAGRGAFATRFIPKGGLVAPLPLIHIGNRNIFTMYQMSQENEHGYFERDTSAPYHKQLLLNYCFGHNDTSLLLCPYGLLTALINHSHQQPNAKIVWTNNQRHPEWLNQSYHIWHNTKHSGLSFDAIALRDIHEDEEIFIDYGAEWETAWQEHLANFDVPRRGYMPAFEMNQQLELMVKTTHEIDYEKLEGIYTFCRKTMVDLALGADGALDNDEEFETEVKDENNQGCYPCRVVQRNHNNSYIVELFVRNKKDHPSGMWEIWNDVVKYVLFDVPRDTFFFHDAFYMRDHHQYWSFRHEMRIPDEIFPSAWRDSLHGEILIETEKQNDDDQDDDDDDDDEEEDNNHDESPTKDTKNLKATNLSNKKKDIKKLDDFARDSSDEAKDEL